MHTSAQRTGMEPSAPVPAGALRIPDQRARPSRCAGMQTAFLLNVVVENPAHAHAPFGSLSRLAAELPESLDYI